MKAIKRQLRDALYRRGYVVLRRDVYESLTLRAAAAAGDPPPRAAAADPLPSLSSSATDSGNATAGAELDAVELCRRARAAREHGDDERAARLYMRAMAVIHKFGPARAGLRELSQAKVTVARDLRDASRAKPLLVRAVELDPDNAAARERLAKLVTAEGGRDLTRECMVFHDAQRAETVHREAVLRCLEYVSIAGVIGDVLEFGVLAGWSARIFAETMRDLMNFADLHLFDSFDGLPEYTSNVDLSSYEIGGRNIWADRMRFPDEFVRQLGASIDRHVHVRLSEVISPDRIRIHKGFYSDSLKTPLDTKAALVHMDCDLYQSAKEVLWRLLEADVYQDGCVMMFDDWNCNKASPNYGERRAFQEFLDGQPRYTATPFFTYGFNGAAFFLHDRDA